MSRSRTRLLRVTALVVLTLAVVAAAWAVPAGADTAADLAAARQKASEAQDAANAIAAQLSEAEGRYEVLQDRIAQLEASMVAAQVHIDELTVQVRDRAVNAYVGRGGAADGLSSLMSTSNPMEAARRTQFLAEQNRAGDRAIKDLARTKQDLTDQRTEARQQREAAQAIRDQLVAKNQEMQAALAQANVARDELATRLEKEQAAAAAAEAARIRAQQAAAAHPVGSVGAGQIIANPGGGSFQCPVQGAAYHDDFGPRGGGYHYGIDMFIPTGTPLVAVKAGSFFVMTESAGGNEVYLNANDGNTYFYAHLTQFAGAPRQVSQGEIMGWAGMTGNATAPHLHFEIRLGGPNGEKIDPYPTLQSAGC